MRPKKWSPIDSLNHGFFFAHKQWLFKFDELLFMSKRIKLNKKITKKGVEMGYGDMRVKKWINNEWKNNI